MSKCVISFEQHLQATEAGFMPSLWSVICLEDNRAPKTNWGLEETAV